MVKANYANNLLLVRRTAPQTGGEPEVQAVAEQPVRIAIGWLASGRFWGRIG